MADTDSDATVEFIDSDNECTDPDCKQCTFIGYYGPVYADQTEARFVIGMGTAMFVVKDNKYRMERWFNSPFPDLDAANEAAKIVAEHHQGDHIPLDANHRVDFSRVARAVILTAALINEIDEIRVTDTRPRSESDPTYVIRTELLTYTVEVRRGLVRLYSPANDTCFYFHSATDEMELVSQAVGNVLSVYSSYPPNIGVIMGLTEMAVDRALRNLGRKGRVSGVVLHLRPHALVCLLRHKMDVRIMRKIPIRSHWRKTYVLRAMEDVMDQHTNDEVWPTLEDIIEEFGTRVNVLQWAQDKKYIGTKLRRSKRIRKSTAIASRSRPSVWYEDT